jgi:hypothetical protein
MEDQRPERQPQADSTHGGLSPEIRNDRSGRPQRRLFTRTWLVAVAGAAVVVIGAGLLHVGETAGLAKADPAQSSAVVTPSIPHFNGTVVRVLVNAELGTVLVDMSTSSPQTTGAPSSAAGQPAGPAGYSAGAVHPAAANCTAER